MVKCKYEGTGIWNGRCTGTKEVDPCPGYDKCKQYKPNYTTNAGRIRAMSIAELNDFLRKVADHDDDCPYEYGSVKSLEWLKKPYAQKEYKKI